MNSPVFNELSVASSSVATQERVRVLRAVLKELFQLGFPPVVRCVRDLLDRELEPGVTLRSAISPPQLARDESRQILSRLSKGPYVEELHTQGEKQKALLVEVTHRGERALGAAVAWLYDVPVVSLSGQDAWEVDPLPLCCMQLDEAGTEETTDVYVVQLALERQLVVRKPYLLECLESSVESGENLWQRRTELLPNLSFCDAAREQLHGFSGNDVVFRQVVKALRRLDRALLEWKQGAFDPGMNASGESNTTLTHPKYGRERMFLCPDGIERKFSNHLKITGGRRIYYLESPATTTTGATAIIGYVGVHLHSVNYP